MTPSRTPSPGHTSRSGLSTKLARRLWFAFWLLVTAVAFWLWPWPIKLIK